MEQSTRFDFDVVVTRSGWAVVSVFVWLRQTKAFLTRTGEPSPSPEALFPLTTFVSWVSSPNHNFGLGNNSRKLSLVPWDPPYPAASRNGSSASQQPSEDVRNHLVETA
jgi:hypothetical protein